MHSLTLLQVAFAFALSSTSAIAVQITPHADGQCSQPLTNYSWKDKLNANFELGTGWPSYNTYPSATFPGAESAGKTPGYDVFWNVQQLDTSCHAVLMLEYSQLSYGSLGFNAPPGNIVVNANRNGCFYSHIPVGAHLFMSFCCGQGDCSFLNAGNNALIKRDVEEIDRRSLSVTARAAELAATRRGQSFDPDSCKTSVESGPRAEAGQQTMVSSVQTCTTATCSFSVSRGVTVSTSLTSTSEQTITNGFGTSISVKTGLNFIVDFEASASIEYNFAKAITKSQSQSVMNSTAVTVTNNVGQQLGTTAFVTFTPTYLCYFAKVDCGAGPSDSFSLCQPQLTENGDKGKTLQGDYNVVYIG